jgi:MFS family permease
MPILFRSIGEAFQVGMARQGQLQSTFFLGAFLVGFWGGPLFERLGAINTGVVCLFLLSAGAATIALSPLHTVLLLGATVFGIGNAWLTAMQALPVAIDPSTLVYVPAIGVREPLTGYELTHVLRCAAESVLSHREEQTSAA